MEDNKTLIKQQPQPELEADEFREEFKCCVCLDLLYKPVVLGCGHISCFWCVFNAMNAVRESYCAVCRRPYNHFPSICQLLHFLLQKLYPKAYKQREKQVREEEKEFGYFSPQFDNPISGSHPTEESNILDNVQSKNSESCSSGVGGSPSLVNSPETTLDDEANSKRPTTSLKNVEATGKAAIKEDCLHDSGPENGTHNKVSVSDLLCAACKNLLFQPVVLNCGHVYCKSCINIPVDGVSRCHICQSMHPNGFPSVCLILEHFLEEQYPEIYAQRRSSSIKQADLHAHQRAGQPVSTLSDDYLSGWSGIGQKVHFAIGCDCCGMSPIIGERYKCKDCVEKMGFDLCGACYNAPFKIPGRFNQQHKPEHVLELVPPQIIPVLHYQSDEDGAEFQEDLENIPAAPIPQDLELVPPEIMAMLSYQSDEDGAEFQEDLENIPAAPIPQDPENGPNIVPNFCPAFVMSVDNLDPDDDSDDGASPDVIQECEGTNQPKN
ncbi:unnamed protein product [Prunus armeniaca]|uniref:RING-type domain-containing protein n=1 Tax=Prunus armeniaca TaxID=36596 RepID=A0A6J5TC88_PRUAR|nr:unnamed protein product [Prunus armeniaca]